MDVQLYNGLSLAYIGDAVYELFIREYFLKQGLTKVNRLHQQVTAYTSGSSQAEAIHFLLEKSLLTEEEIMYFKRGRNAHVHTTRKNIDLQTYLDATGFEALIGFLYLSGNQTRIKELLTILLEV